jgi:hypothetical protein
LLQEFFLMRSELSLAAPATRILRGPDTGGVRRARGDVVAVAILIALPVLVFGIPALAGHTVLPGDDFSQNFPLRVLAGRQIRGGHLPLYDPYIWSGAPAAGAARRRPVSRRGRRSARASARFSGCPAWRRSPPPSER